MARVDPQLKLRLPEGLKNALTRAAEKNGRSMNAEIVSRLETSIGFEDEYGTLEEVMRQVWADIDQLKSNVDELGRHTFPERFDWK